MRDISGYAYSQKELKELFGGHKVSPFLEFNFDSIGQGPLESIRDSLSVSGVQEKFPAIIREGRITLCAHGEKSTHILKPHPSTRLKFAKDIPANEHLTMQIASVFYQMRTAPNGVCFTPEGDVVYITKRFDVTQDGKRLVQEDFATLLGKRKSDGSDDEFKYDGTYLEIGQLIPKVTSASMVELETFLRIVIFNYIFGNGDAHLKNFSVLHGKNGSVLSPAYDLLNTQVHIQGPVFALKGELGKIRTSDIYDRTGNPCADDFREFGLALGLPEKVVDKTVSMFMEIPKGLFQMIDDSFIKEDKAKRIYKRIATERFHRFGRSEK